MKKATFKRPPRAKKNPAAEALAAKLAEVAAVIYKAAAPEGGGEYTAAQLADRKSLRLPNSSSHPLRPFICCYEGATPPPHPSRIRYSQLLRMTAAERQQLRQAWEASEALRPEICKLIEAEQLEGVRVEGQRVRVDVGGLSCCLGASIFGVLSRLSAAHSIPQAVFSR